MDEFSVFLRRADGLIAVNRQSRLVRRQAELFRDLACRYGADPDWELSFARTGAAPEILARKAAGATGVEYRGEWLRPRGSGRSRPMATGVEYRGE